MVVVRTLWMVGDDFFRSLFGSLAAICTQARIHNSKQPYIYDNFEVVALHKNSYGNTRSCLARINNAMVEELNKEYKLPKCIVIFLDSDIIEMAEIFDCGVKAILDNCFKWLYGSMDQNIKTQKEDIVKKNPGALYAKD